MKRILLAIASAFLVLAGSNADAWADCGAAPLGSTDDLAISFLAGQGGTQAAPSSQLASSVKKGTLVYDSATDQLKICDGTNWLALAAGGTSTLAGLSDVTLTSPANGEFLKFNGTAWVNSTVSIPAGVAGTDKQLQFNDGGSTLAGATQLLWDKTNNRLTVGTTTPGAYTVDVTGKTATSSLVLKTLTGANAPTVDTLAGGSEGSVQYNDASLLGGNSTFIWNKTSERLLIGSATAYATDGAITPRVQIHGPSATTGSLSLTAWLANAASPGSLVLGKSRGAAVGTNTIVASGDTLGGIFFNGDDGTGFKRAAFIDVQVDGTPGAGDMPGRLRFLTTADGAASSTERMRITSAGNVGIGTTAPVSPLTLKGSGNTVTTIGAKENRLFMIDDSTTVNNGAEIVVGTADTTTGRYAAIGTNIIANNSGQATGDVYIATKATTGATILTPRVYVQAAGNVGIGTTAPMGIMHIKGGSWATLTLESAADDAIIQLTKVNPASLNDDWTMRLDESNSDVLQWRYDNTAKLTLYTSGNATLVGTLTQSSDRRLKHNITPLSGALDKLATIEAVNFEWKDPLSGAGKQIGLIAQDVENVYPELVITDEKGMKSVAYANMVAPLIEAVKELKAENDALRLRVEKLEAGK